MINYSNLESLCQQKAEEVTEKDFFKFNHAGANCVKIIWEIMSEISGKHKDVYDGFRNVTFGAWRVIIFKTGLIKEFTDRGVVEVSGPGPGVFVFWASRPEHPELIWDVGLCVNKKEMYHLDGKKKVFEKCNIMDKKPVFFGALDG